MLGKLFRNEFKCTWKTVVGIFALVAVITVYGCLVYGVEAFHTGKLGNVMASVFLICYVLSIFALFFATFIYLCVRFFKTMYSDQGYLTHTLPVSTLANFNTKLITALVWMILSGVMLLVSIFTIMFSEVGKEMIRALGELDLVYEMIDQACMESIGYHALPTLCIILLAVVVMCLHFLLLIFAALSLGQLSNQHKIGCAVGCGVGIYIVEQVISSVFLLRFVDRVVGMSVVVMTESEAGAVYAARSYTHNFIWTSIGVYATYAIVEYLICAVVLKKRVNLE